MFCLTIVFKELIIYSEIELKGKIAMRVIQSKSQSSKDFQEKISLMFEQSLTEEQRFLQGIMNGEIELISHDEVMEKLEYVLKNGLNRK